MAKMSLLEWVGLIIVIIVLQAFVEHKGYGWLGEKSADKKSVSVK